MTVLELTFPAGRYHATPWGRHVNEGAVEWPPSPWRIVRALIATWHLKARNNDEIPESIARALVDALSQQPTFSLPRATTSHTRHYMPGRGDDKPKVFDTFIQVAEKEPVLVAWHVDLPPEQLTALKSLVERLGYLGRAESLVEARVLEGMTAIESNARPFGKDQELPEKMELIRLLAPMKPKEYHEWRETFIKEIQTPSSGKKRKGKKAAAVIAPSVPEDLFGALHADTGDLQSAGWNLPPGAEFVNYVRPENVFTPAIKPRLPRRRELPSLARYAVVSAVAPSITQALSVADRVHDALCKWSDQGKGRASVFTGLGADGRPRSDHAHAHIFCEANGPRDAITHITVWAPMGFDEAACFALRKLNKVWGHGGHDIRLVLHGIGRLNDFQGCPLLAAKEPVKVWRTVTPFISTRHTKAFRDGRPKIDANGWQIGSPGHDLLRLLALHPHGSAATIKQIDERDRPFRFGSRCLRSLQFQTVRHGGGGNRGNSFGSAFVITFPEPISGPLSLGYGSHFGLGLFQPINSSGAA